MNSIFKFVDYTEPGENNYSDGICHLVILFYRVILYVRCSPPYSVTLVSDVYFWYYFLSPEVY